jgi:Ni/Co efflux regulator RcnB
MKMFIMLLAFSIAAWPVTVHATESPSDRVHHHLTVHHKRWRDPFKPRTTNGLSSNRNACASYGCVDAGGGGD